MADPNAQPMHQHHLNQQHRAVQHQPLSIGGPGVPHLLLDPQTLAAAPPPLHPQHQFQPQHYSVLDSFWQRQVHEIRNEDHDFKVHQLPLARIKKVMKTDEEVKMISAEAPILFAKGCDIFITELTMRAWLHAEECKRRTLQRSDIANAIKKVDMFDFLIDIVPREEKVTVKTEKIEYPDHQSPYYGLGVPQGGHQFNTSSSIPIDHKIIVDSMAQQQQMYMQRMESQHQQMLHDHSEQHQHQQHQQPPLLPPLTPVAGQQVSSYRPQNHPQFSHVSANVSAGPVRQVTTDQPYQHHPYYHHSGFQQHSQELHHPQNQTPSQHHRQSEHNPVQVKYEFERSEWYPHQTNTQLNGHTQSGYGQHHVSSSSSHGYGQPLDQSSHEYNHENTGMHSSSGTSSMSNILLQSSSSEEDLQLLMEQRKKKRKQSNRESARRSRMRKQKHLDDLIAQVDHLKKQKSLTLMKVDITTKHYLEVKAENSILWAQKTELTQSLQSLNDIIDLINTTNGVYHTDCYDINNHNNHNNYYNNNNNFMNPMHMAYLNQPIVATADNMFLW